MRILIAEEEARLRVELAASLEVAGFNVVEAENGQEGLWTRPELVCPPIRLHMRTRQVMVQGCLIELSSFEYRLLEHLMLRAGETVSRTALAQRLYREKNEPEYNAVDALIVRIRRKIDPDGSLAPIATVRGVGYRFVRPRGA